MFPSEAESAVESEDNEFVEVLVSYDPVEATDDGIVVTGENGQATVTADPTPEDVTVERLAGAVEDNDVWRARLQYHAGDGLGVELTVSTK